VERVIKDEPFIVHGQEVSHVKVLKRFFSRILNLLKIHYPGDAIRELVVTVENPELKLMEAIYKALEELGIEKDRAMIIGHKQSFLYYTLCQKKDIWLNDVGLFDFNEAGLRYYQLAIDRSKKPIIVGVTEKDFSETLYYGMVHPTLENREGLLYVFENIARSVLHRQIVSTLYMIGRGFDGDWPNPVLQRLCAGRRVFKGKNLYVKGACYAAKERSGSGRLEEFIFLDDDMLPCHICSKMYVDGEEKEVVFVKAGTPWFDAECNLDFIPDEEEELQLVVRNLVTKDEARHLISLEIVRDRPRRMTRINLRIRFQDRNHCVVTIKDKGFGEMYGSSNRIWERTIQI
jgi:hypothetical protein